MGGWLTSRWQLQGWQGARNGRICQRQGRPVRRAVRQREIGNDESIRLPGGPRACPQLLSGSAPIGPVSPEIGKAEVKTPFAFGVIAALRMSEPLSNRH